MLDFIDSLVHASHVLLTKIVSIKMIDVHCFRSRGNEKRSTFSVNVSNYR